MTRSLSLLIILIVLTLSGITQEFYRTGSPDNVDSIPEFGILLAGGASDNDDGMQWLAKKANGGDVVVLRASGSDGYNDYIYSQLDVEVNSVTSIVITSTEQASNTEVCQTAGNAEVIFIAGGNQWNYYNHWNGTCLQETINSHVNDKGGAIGGTSAGLAILGEAIYTAEQGSVWSEEALNNPYHWRITLERNFLDIPFLENIVTDSHYNNIYGDDNDRQGRHMAFMARMITDWQMEAKGMGVNEYTAVGVEPDGTARVFGNPAYDDYAYFHITLDAPEVCEEEEPLHWTNGQNAVAVYRVLGDTEGSRSFNLSNWQEGNGGEWFRWYVDQGELIQVEGSPVNVEPHTYNEDTAIRLYPNPADDIATLVSENGTTFSCYRIFDISGRLVREQTIPDSRSYSFNFSDLLPGTYVMKIHTSEGIVPLRIIKK